VFVAGYISFKPEPNTAMVFPPTSKQLECAIVSTPSQRPLTIVNPALLSSLENCFVTSNPYRETRLVPTMATQVELNNSALPL